MKKNRRLSPSPIINSVWMSDNQTSMFVSEGKADGSNKVITMEGKTNCPATGRRDIPMKTVLRIVSPDQHVFEMYDRSKGNAKTMVLAGLMLYALTCDDEPGAQIVAAAVTREQARELYDAARHSFASLAVSGGASLYLVGGLLGHRKATTTQRYAHLSADPLRAVNDAVGQRLAAALEGR